MVVKNLNIPYNFQMAHQTKNWKEDDMEVFEKRGNKYYINGKQTNDHVRSATKHFMVWYGKEREVEKAQFRTCANYERDQEDD